MGKEKLQKNESLSVINVSIEVLILDAENSPSLNSFPPTDLIADSLVGSITLLCLVLEHKRNSLLN